MSLDVDIKKKLAYFAKQVEFLDKLLDYKIARLPKHFHPYANLHFRKAYDEKLLKSVEDNHKHIFHVFHRIGNHK